jgi:hypothetical protein
MARQRTPDPHRAPWVADPVSKPVFLHPDQLALLVVGLVLGFLAGALAGAVIF